MNAAFTLLFTAILFAICPLFASAQSQQSASEEASRHYESARLALQQDQPDVAVNEMLEAVELDPKNAEYRNQLALAYFRNRQTQEMWEQLRAGARLDPNHPKLVQGLLAYWNIHDKQGLFNLGVALQKVVDALGEPDQRVENPQHPSQTRLIYGFLAVELHDQKVFEVLDLRGLKAEHFRPQETVTFETDGRSWKPVYRTNNQYSATVERTVDGQPIQSWSQLLSVQRLHNVASRVERVGEVARNIIKGLRQTNPEAEYRIVDESPQEIVFEWKISANEKADAQHEIVKLMMGQRDIHRIAFAAKTDKLDEQTRATWMAIISDATLTLIDSVDEIPTP